MNHRGGVSRARLARSSTGVSALTTALALALLAGCGGAVASAAPDPAVGESAAAGDTDLRLKAPALQPAATSPLRVELELAGTETDAKGETSTQTLAAAARDELAARRAAEEGAGAQNAPVPAPPDKKPTALPGGDQFGDGSPPEKPTPAAASSRRIEGTIDPTSIRESLASARDTFTRCLEADMNLELELTSTPAGDVAIG